VIRVPTLRLGGAGAVLALALALLPAARAAAEKPYLTLASTTSTQDSGLFGHLLPHFEAETGVSVRVVAVGTGQALELGRRGDADALLVHDRAAEERFLAEGFAESRRDVMWNDFLIAGPAADPAAVKGLPSAAGALRRIAEARAPFASRGDDSGTHKAELRLWKEAGIGPKGASGTWYRETGGGMGATLNTAAELGAYLLVDRATWVAFRNKRSLAALVEGDAPLRNPYGVLVVSPAKHPHVKAALARRFSEWLTSGAGRAAIDGFRVDGVQLFHAEQPGAAGAR
jgi:tungstate transport system substrate-binding protein